MVITLYIFITKSVKRVSDGRKLQREEALRLVFGSDVASGMCAQVDQCSSGKTAFGTHKAAAAWNSCTRVLSTCPSQS